MLPISGIETFLLYLVGIPVVALILVAVLRIAVPWAIELAVIILEIVFDD